MITLPYGKHLGEAKLTIFDYVWRLVDTRTTFIPGTGMILAHPSLQPPYSQSTFPQILNSNLIMASYYYDYQYTTPQQRTSSVSHHIMSQFEGKSFIPIGLVYGDDYYNTISPPLRSFGHLIGVAYNPYRPYIDVSYY